MTPTERFTKLDGLRGLLSIIVALNHSYLVVAIPSFANVWNQNYLAFFDLQSKIQQILMLMGNGGAAVTLFFILSGLVLGQSLSRIEISLKGLLSFYTKRLLRLYPVYIFVILLIAIYMRLGFTYQVFPAASAWFNWWLNFQMTLKEFFYNFFFIHTYLGGVTWTLRVIILASFLFPLFYTVTKKTSWFTDILIILALIYASFTLFDIPDFRDFRYLYMFYLGLMLPKFKGFFVSIPAKLNFLIVPAGLVVLLCYRYSTDEYLGGLAESLVSWLFIGTMVYSEKTKIFDFLNHKYFLFFGKISYSLYLIHFSILYILARFMFIYLPNLPYASHYLLIHTILFLVSLPIATLVSALVYRHVEVPSVTWASRAGRKILES